jgi:diguanylate cyclase (GGDEF)-like protein
MDEENALRGADHDDPDETDEGSEDRDRIAEDRDHRAQAQDQVSEARDDRAEARDELAHAREQATGEVDPGAAADRLQALQDRRQGAIDRTQAADDREAASDDRAVSAREREASSIDELTGAHRREAGLVELKRELARARRTKQSLVLAFIDVDHLKVTNDERGHAAGDQLLREVARAIRSRLRSYDLIIRFGGDEFVCALLDLSLAEVEKRFALVNAALRETRQASVSFGLAELEPADGLDDLFARADGAMYEARQQRQAAGPDPP